tara:strand:- start:86 stop:280 length:195 start_codon:yes stop_codon:yes gene_type:complete
MKGILIDCDKYNEGQARHAKNRDRFVFVLATTHEDRKRSCGHNKKDHPKVKILVDPKGGGDDRK